ncbi:MULTISPECIES: helix-turn-helix transcriptional regulator [unclassified Kaistella]|uniref:ArsR/SmtB family transcription factor n=1 Tax=unclassified Kaistella TaxID=2762626 RepID=UPI002735196B|nr:MULTISPECIES: metalloregulator ArsR/SmtB family transcription factor [unclassified Kaistella]MDP2455189.1 metalloregulator ArsR/SmtB family transcription factor [Kaistella sp. SH11-4b]MDP2458163.1 metalloregulator ArsR/SmtB family transcription factor [Kaistella sp. SH40-3]MDP2460956.1 metalloregulator ArsR/SmtB family transcription factor [Kaistella sp. SH19-2b]
MGASKTEHFSEQQNEMAKIAKALAHPARIAILEHLLKVNECICGDIVSELPLAQPTVSQHLKEMKNAGLIKGTIEGNSVCYCLNEKTIEKLHLYFKEISINLSERNTCC